MKSTASEHLRVTARDALTRPTKILKCCNVAMLQNSISSYIQIKHADYSVGGKQKKT